MLSGTLFLFHLLQCINFAPSETPLVITFFSDNSGLIQRVTQRCQYCTPYPNTTLAPDWDIIEQIYTTTAQLQHCSASHKWVKGHQNAMSTDLPTEAKYNIEADALAGRVRVPPQWDHPQWILPAEKCRLFIGTVPIHGHYPHEIRQS